MFTAQPSKDVPLGNLSQCLTALLTKINCRWSALRVFILIFFFWKNRVTKALAGSCPRKNLPPVLMSLQEVLGESDFSLRKGI